MEINEFIKEIQNLQKAKELLKEVWLDIEVYYNDSLSPEVIRKLNDYFELDDSE